MAPAHERFGAAVEFFNPFKTIAFDGAKVGGAEPEQIATTAAVAVGLALRKAGDR